MTPFQLAPVKTLQQHIPLRGGMDQATPTLEAKPGTLRDSSNFDVNTLGGYQRIDGYEKWDGQQLCNSYGYSTLVTLITAPINPGQTIKCLSTGATGKVIYVDDQGYVYFVFPTGTLKSGDQLHIQGSPVGLAQADPFVSQDRSTALSATLMYLSAQEYRAAIQTVPGAGPIRGLHYFHDALYAFRNAANNLTTNVFKSSPAGWVQVPLGTMVAFTAASGVLTNGQVLTKGAVTATISRVVIRSGSLGSSTAAGHLIISTPAGGSFSAGAATVAGGTLTLSGAQAAITHAPNGRFDCEVSNFGESPKMYWASGVDYAFEFDGAVAVPIITGMAVDRPSKLAVHKNHLFLAFDNSLQHSGIGNPYVWSAVFGAAELNMGETISNMLPKPSDAQSGGAMVVSTRNSMFMLYGSSSADWQLVTFQRDVGSISNTMQNIASETYYLDDRGITNLTQTQSFGNFASSTISAKVRAWLMNRKANAIDSCVIKDKNQFRLFFQGGTAMHITFDGAKLSGCMPVQYGHNITLSHSSELPDGTEAVFYGDDAGNVYMADNGPSFAGEKITAFFKLQFNHCNSPRVIKRFRKVTFEVGGSGYSDFAVGTELGYGTYDVNTQPIDTVTAAFTGPRWDDPAAFWDGSVWDGRILLPAEVSLSGSEENISLTVYQSSLYYMGLNFQSALLQYSPRRIKR